jgi:hypothetical protein
MLHESQAIRIHRARLAIVLGRRLTGLTATATAHADELVVDNADGVVQITGGWPSTSTSPGFYGGDYLFKPPETGASKVTWLFPNRGAAGRYAVFARWTSGSNRASNATYQVSSTDAKRGRAEVPVGVPGLNRDRVPGIDLEDGRQAVVPGEMQPLGGQRVVCHWH